MSATLEDLRNAVVATLLNALPGVNVASHGGTFTAAELKRYATSAPAVRVALVGVGKAERYNDGRLRLPIHFAAVVITKDEVAPGRKVDRDLAALALSGAVGLVVAGNRFGLEGVFQPENQQARSEYSGEVDAMGIALWQITWTSGLLMGAAVADAITALSQLWINGVEMAAGAEILPQVTLGAPIAPAFVGTRHE